MSHSGFPPMTNSTTTNTPPTVSSKTSSWELPSGALMMVPQHPLRNEDGYAAWALQMKGALHYATLWQVASGTEAHPATDAGAIKLWERRDGAVQTMILRMLDLLLHTLLQDQRSSKGYWDTLKQQFSHTSLDSAVTWMRNLTNPLASLKDLDVHIQSFINTVAHICSSGFDIPEPLAAGLFLSTLKDRDGEPSQWLTFTAKFTLQKATTLNETIADVRNKCRHVQANQDAPSTWDSSLVSVEAAYAALEWNARFNGRKWCCYCQHDGHEYSECCSKNKQKGKEKSNVAWDEDEDSTGSADEHSHFVRSEHVLYTAVDQYTMCETASLRDSPVTDFVFITAPPTHDSASAWGSRSRKSRTMVIDSGTSSHVHSVKSDFIDICPTSTTI